MLTTKQAAKYLNYEESHIRRIATKLGGQKLGRDWFFKKEDLDKYKSKSPKF
jgi:excisionase family DNA binding protein